MVNVGEIIAGKYRVERVLGAGAMGVVVAVRHLELGEPRAIKFMLPAALGSLDGVERFMREARAAARLKSQHAVKVHDIDKHESGAPYIVMEHLEGVDLRTWQRERGALPVDEAALYMLQACEAIAEAHSLGIIHRDIKPGNMFRAAGAFGAPCIKVLDFGIAKVITPNGPQPENGHLTNTHAIMGSPSYMSPEQIGSTRDVDPRADIWSLGVVLYSFVTNELPFSGATMQDKFRAVLADAPRRPSLWRPDLPPELDRIILRCLEKDAALRYQTVPELAAALLPFAAEQHRVPLSFAAAAPVSQTVPLEQGAGAANTSRYQPEATQTVPREPSPAVRPVVIPPSASALPPTLALAAPVGTQPYTPPSVQSPPRRRSIAFVGGGIAVALLIAVVIGVSLRSPGEAAPEHVSTPIAAPAEGPSSSTMPSSEPSPPPAPDGISSTKPTSSKDPGTPKEGVKKADQAPANKTKAVPNEAVLSPASAPAASTPSPTPGSTTGIAPSTPPRAPTAPPRQM